MLETDILEKQTEANHEGPGPVPVDGIEIQHEPRLAKGERSRSHEWSTDNADTGQRTEVPAHWSVDAESFTLA